MAKRKQMNKLIAITATAALLMAITACGDEGQTSPPPTDPNPIEDPVTEPTDPVEEPGDESMQGTGTYVGQIDNNSIEIETEEGPTAFRLGEGMDAVVAELQGNESVTFTYTEEPLEGTDGLVHLILTDLKVEDGNSGSGETGNLPPTKEIELELEGMTETKTAELVEAEGYAFYMFDIYSFDAENNRLTMDVDSDYYAEITKLPSDYNLEDLKTEAEQELAEAGNAREADENERKDFEGAELFMVAQGDGLTKKYIVNEVDGQGYVFHINIPQGEPTEGFVPHTNASLNSIVNK
ncbi:hypothetical protein JCM10914A_07380 [Paenibacillus sp. JCM 10914]|uniref:hypothetical protein n=1 Tax=Paenibacillus sp. JCM 10914 TaxID=1236974 RepID=UPI0003CC4919|nr:hypothetical protein [Paenibacillus sp. JCM 10914]GAE05755.1 hypothetical protein JCM10914_1876 [Paenibacillus sp. JCM 10914]